MSKPVTPHAAYPPGGMVISTNDAGEPAIVVGTSVPASGSPGYGPGCLFIHSDGSTGDAVYVNNGTSAACDFQALATAGVQVVVPLSLASFREVDSSGDVGNSDANGGVLASNTTPVLRAGSTESFEIFWAAGNVDTVAIGISLPGDLDDTQDAYVDLYVQADTTDQAPSFTVGSSWQAGTQVTDAATAAASTAIQKITATISSSDIPAQAAFVTFQLTPAAHATSAFQLHAARLRYVSKPATG